MYKNRNCPVHSHEERVTVDWPMPCHQEHDLVHCIPSPTKLNLRNQVSWLCSWTAVCWEHEHVALNVLAGFLLAECSSQFHSVYSCILSCSVMSDSLWPHGLWPARLLCPHSFPGCATWEALVFTQKSLFSSATVTLGGIFQPLDNQVHYGSKNSYWKTRIYGWGYIC